MEFVPASFKVIEHVRLKYACRRCQEHVAIAAKPPQPIEKGLPGPGLLAHTVLSKYGDHAPLYRQEDVAAPAVLEAAGTKETLIAAVRAAAARSRELGRG